MMGCFELRRLRVLLALLGFVLLCTGAARAQTATETPTEGIPTATPTPGGDCCSAHGGPGCNDSACQLCVCAVPDQDVCCNDVWDDICVDVARTVGDCAESCPCEPLPTPTSEPTTPTPTPGGNCCEPHSGASCEDTACAACVCALEDQDVCCTDGWDEICAEVAADECAGSCPCGLGECCTEHEEFPGCESAVCERCVCAVDGQEFCCTDGWDAECADVARDECAGSCPCVPAECCTSNTGPGCESAVCMDCVCEIDPVCCAADGIWDQSCVEIATDPDTCAGFCACNFDDCCAVGDSPGCEGAVCQDCVCNGDTECCSNVWDSFCVDEATDPETCGPSCACGPEECCTTHENPGCNDVDCVDCVCTVDPQCCTLAWDDFCVQQAALECQGRCPCGAGNNCCAPNDSAGCEDAACEDCVCELDSRCCAFDGVWDEFCVEIAFNTQECATVCPCSDCCRGQSDGVQGCEDSTCAECVCSFEGQDVCCTGEGGAFWDDICADVANTECAADCMCVVIPGDCNEDGQVAINELVLVTDLNVSAGDVETCRWADPSGNGVVTVDEVLLAVDQALAG